MLVKEDGEYPDCESIIKMGLVYVSGHFGGDKWSGVININTDESIGSSLLELDYQPASGKLETIRIPD